MSSTAERYIELGDYKTGKDLLQKSLSEAVKSQVPGFKATPLAQLAQIELFQGNSKQAALLAEQALDSTNRKGVIHDIHAYHILAQSYGELGDEAKAFEGDCKIFCVRG
ncbi:MAG: hypothetical protein HC860_13155 [Alkalinema sp. RU_4_3]|nr:hypothetical protein [Alkalinema sp. RU_4_3]